jgi:predicted acetyltransferase
MPLLTRPTTRVHASFLAAMSEEGLGGPGDDTVIGRYAGHIGYVVRPSARRRGHATAMLAAALPVANALGIDPALVTCDEDNIASRKVIEASGGTLEDQRGAKLRFWLPTS